MFSRKIGTKCMYIMNLSVYYDMITVNKYDVNTVCNWIELQRGVGKKHELGPCVPAGGITKEG
jgi:hypothetical protein